MAFIYCADVWCDRCGEEIRKRIAREGNAPADPDDEYSYDSDEFPKCARDDEESDTPSNCAAGEECYEAESLPSGQRIGKQFGELTADGVVYLQEAIAEGGEVAEFWADYYNAYLD